MSHLALPNLVAQLTTAPIDRSYDLTAGGWITMILSVGFVTGLLGWCILKVMRESHASKLHAPLDADVDTRDSVEDRPRA